MEVSMTTFQVITHSNESPKRPRHEEDIESELLSSTREMGVAFFPGDEFEEDADD
jgi:hypothetical protein